ncbi:MAG: type II toxin-antitoxin system HicB family antitoxin [Endomicrobiales bacterium]
MRYKIIIERKENGNFSAHCADFNTVKAEGGSVNEALLSLQQDLLCYLHDPEAAFEITIEHRGAGAGQGAV